MGWRILQISKPCKLSVKNRRLVYEPFEEASLTIPLEDISVVILENRQILLANSLLSELPEYDIVLFTCDFHICRPVCCFRSIPIPAIRR